MLPPPTWAVPIDPSAVFPPLPAMLVVVAVPVSTTPPAAAAGATVVFPTWKESVSGLYLIEVNDIFPVY